MMCWVTVAKSIDHSDNLNVVGGNVALNPHFFFSFRNCYSKYILRETMETDPFKGGGLFFACLSLVACMPSSLVAYWQTLSIKSLGAQLHLAAGHLVPLLLSRACACIVYVRRIQCFTSEEVGSLSLCCKVASGQNWKWQLPCADLAAELSSLGEVMIGT